MAPPHAVRSRARVVRLLLMIAMVVLLTSSALPAVGSGVQGAAGGADPVGAWPLVPRPRVVHGFDPPGCTWCAGHRGVDLSGFPVQVVRAALPGTVTFAGRLAGKGVVVIDQGATRTTYEPVAATVHRGDVVSTGAPIGRLETLGSHCFPSPCLHLGLIRNADRVYLDPLTLLPAAPQRVRLLPLWPDLSPAEPVSAGASGPRPGGITALNRIRRAARALMPADAPAGRRHAAGRC